jgi:hypothetical protein
MRWRYVITLWTLAVLAGAAWGFTDRPPQAQYQQTYVTAQEEGRQIAKKRPTLLKRGFMRITALSAATWTAFATLLLVLVTGLLVWVAYQQTVTVRGQTRAYVFIRGGEIRLVNNSNAIQATIQLENFGQTPGYEFETWTGIRLGKPGDNPYSNMGAPNQKSIIAPRADLNVPSDSIPLSPFDRAEVNAGNAKIFVWGYARFRDAFGRRWEFVFRDTNGSGEVAAANWRGWGITPDLRFGYTETQR